MKKKIIIVFLVLAVVTTGIIFYTIGKNQSKTTLKTISKNDIENIDWSSYSSEEITLTKSIEITQEGIYKLTGTINDGYIYINTDGKVKLVLNNVTITNSSGPAIYIENAKIVEINTLGKTVNNITDGYTYKGFDDDIDACIFSRDDLLLTGDGTLKVNANYKDGIVSKDDLEITGGSYNITAVNDALKGKDSIEISDGAFTINATGDAITSTNSTEEDKGYIIIDGGTYNIKTTGKTSDNSTKGIKATNMIVINDGAFNLDNTDDAIHTDGNIIINGGTYNIESTDDAIHADGMLEINDGEITITAHEGLEATYVKINDGNITINATDDGINAGRKSSKYNVTIEITGGNITIKMGPGDTDGIDSNGNLYISGGTVNITANSPFDYDGEAKYTGGTLIVNGTKTSTITNQTFGGDMPNGGRRMR